MNVVGQQAVEHRARLTRLQVENEFVEFVVCSHAFQCGHQRLHVRGENGCQTDCVDIESEEKECMKTETNKE